MSTQENHVIYHSLTPSLAKLVNVYLNASPTPWSDVKEQVMVLFPKEDRDIPTLIANYVVEYTYRENQYIMNCYDLIEDEYPSYSDYDYEEYDEW